MEEVIVLQITLVVKKDVNLLVSGSKMNNIPTLLCFRKENCKQEDGFKVTDR